MIQVGDCVSGEITTLAYGGEGILKSDGLVIFVPFTAPGDHITCKITQKKKNFARGEVVEIQKRSALRVVPRCPYFGTCGGCQLQHLNYDAQLQSKKESVQASLKKIGSLAVDEVPIVPADTQWTYRRHITLTVEPQKKGYKAGYIAVDYSFLPVDCCPIFISENETSIFALQNLLSHVQSSERGRVSIIKQENQFLLQFHFPKMPSNMVEVGKNALKDGWKGIAISSPEQNVVLGDFTAFWEIEQTKFTFSPTAFIQNYPEQSLNIYRKIGFFAAEIKPKVILDLYCGVGILSLLLARQGSKVIGVEVNAQAVEQAKNNALGTTAEFIKADVGDVLMDLIAKEKPDLIVVNPPREGLDKEVREVLAGSKIRHLIYVSCNPTTLARDAHELAYDLEWCEAYDMFPQTYHVETVALFTAKG